ncbi:MAG: glycosyltransferase family 2 protein [Desulfovibrionaceae bacterium]|jgi:GT2 family glycosyltransferase|nr:glycosyltransferase family 2 protein [Desulfovibrionaceae bacterium]
MPRVSLVTFTCNDGDLTRGLLDAARGWTVRPDEIVVVDDGSEPPFVPPEPAGDLPAVRLVRLPSNRGITRANAAGLDAAHGDVLFSVDCDVRPEPGYLAACLRALERPGTGMAAGGVLHAAGDGLTARYLRTFGDNHNLDARGPVELIPGNAYAIPRAVWREVGGFGGHAARVCEDHALCRRVRADQARALGLVPCAAGSGPGAGARSARPCRATNAPPPISSACSANPWSRAWGRS